LGSLGVFYDFFGHFCRIFEGEKLQVLEEIVFGFDGFKTDLKSKAGVGFQTS